MTVKNHLFEQFKIEFAKTRNTLARIPEDKINFKLHEKGSTLLGMGTHLANLITWTTLTVDQTEYDMSPVGEETNRVAKCTSTEEMLSRFDQNTADALAALERSDDAGLKENWSLLAGGQLYFTMKKCEVLQTYVINHLVHHRGQLTMFLRMIDVPLPALYGPSADERGMDLG